MKKTAVFLLFMSILSITGCSRIEELYARVVGGDIVYSDTQKLSPVVFSHKNHIHAGLNCADCHNAIFQMKEGAANRAGANALSMKGLQEGKYCGACHNGKKAFSVNGNCAKCHQHS